MDKSLLIGVLLCLISLVYGQPAMPAEEESDESVLKQQSYTYSSTLPSIDIRCTFPLQNAADGLINGDYAFNFYKEQDFGEEKEILKLNHGPRLASNLDQSVQDHISYHQDRQGDNKAYTSINIMRPEPEDSGVYRCELLVTASNGQTTTSELEYHINIFDMKGLSVKIFADDDPMSIDRKPNVSEWHSSGELQLRQKPSSSQRPEEFAYMACVAENIPMPTDFTITVSLDNPTYPDRTRQLRGEFTPVLLSQQDGGIAGRRRRVINQLVEDREFMVNAMDDGSTIKCEAKLENNKHEVIGSASTSAQLNLLAMPQFMNCSKEVFARMGSKNYKISCIVKSKPALNQARSTWSVQPKSDDEFMISQGQYGYTYKFKAIEGSHLYEAQLFIEEVHDQQHLRAIFKLQATNAIGTSVHRILLLDGDDPNTIATTDSAVKISSALVILLLSAFAAFLVQ